MPFIKKLILLIVVLVSTQSIAIANVYQEEFKNFYDNPVLNFIKCGLNIQNFLTHLKDQGIPLEDGYVVSLHEGFGHLDFFGARWGRTEEYANGETYERSNYFLHFFAVIKGEVYDFSQSQPRGIPLKEYLAHTYLPAYETKPLLLRGTLTKENRLQSFLNLEMKIYKLTDIQETGGPAIYIGRFFELFNHAGIDSVSNPPKGSSQKIPPFKKGTYGSIKMGSSTDYFKSDSRVSEGDIAVHKNPQAYFNGEKYPIKFEGFEICQSLGYLGHFPALSQKKELVDKKARLVDIGTSLLPLKAGEVSAPDDVKVSFRYVVNDQHWNNEIATQVGCGDLTTALLEIAN